MSVEGQASPVSRVRRAAQKALAVRRGGEGDEAAILAELGPGDRAICTELVQGVRRRQWTIDAILRAFLDQPFGRVPNRTLDALRIGVHDLLFRPGVPLQKVVSETVSLAGPRKRARGFLNGVLRNVARSFAVLDAPPSPPDRATVWVEGERWVRFERPVLPEPTEDPVAWAARHYTLPEDAVRVWFTELPLEAGELFRALGQVLPLALRPAGDTTLEALEAELREAGVEVLGRHAGAIEVRVHGELDRLQALREGRASAQDLVASEVAPFAQVEPGQRVLDLCAPPGGKAVGLARALDGRGELVAAHLEGRGMRLAENLERMGGTTPWKLHDLGPEGTRLPEGPFDHVLVDAPCSNSGVLMKRVDARYRLDDRHLSGLRARQDEVLDRAAGLVGPGGSLVYATCSILPDENEERVDAFLSRHPDFVLEESRLRLPHRTGRDGGFMVRLRNGVAAESAGDRQ